MITSCLCGMNSECAMQFFVHHFDESFSRIIDHAFTTSTSSFFLSFPHVTALRYHERILSICMCVLNANNMDIDMRSKMGHVAMEIFSR
jgi:hypothetical protein